MSDPIDRQVAYVFVAQVIEQALAEEGRINWMGAHPSRQSAVTAEIERIRAAMVAASSAIEESRGCRVDPKPLQVVTNGQ